MKRSSFGTIAWTRETSRPSRCIAPPSAQKSFCRSTISTAQCCGRTFSARVLSMASFPDHAVDVEGLRHLVLHGEVEVRLEAADVELGDEVGKRHLAHELRLDAGVLGDPAVALFLGGLLEVRGR